MTKAEFVSIMAVLEAGVGKKIPALQAAVYFDLLGDLPVGALQVAAKRALVEAQYPGLPPIGVLRRLAVEATRPPSLTWGEAWELSSRAIQKYGYTKEAEGLATLPLTVRRAVECLGWQAVCDCDKDRTETLRAQFRGIYESLDGRKQRAALLPPSSGLLPRLANQIGVMPE